MTMNPGTPGLPVAGWYADPQNATQLRWWDGAQWTAHTSPVPQPVAPAPAPAAVEPVVAPVVEPSPAYAPKQGVPQYGEYSTPAQQTSAAQPAAAAAAAPASVAAAMPAYAAQPYATQQPYAGQAYGAQPYGMAPVQPHVPAGTPTASWQIWVVALSPLLGLIPLFFLDIDAILRDALAAEAGDMTSPIMATNPSSLLVTLLSWVLAAVMIAAAVLDWRWLGQRGYPRRFHWAWNLLALLGGVASLVYVIGRSVVVKRQAGRGLAPMWVAIAATVVAGIITIIWIIAVISAMYEAAMYYPGISS